MAIFDIIFFAMVAGFLILRLRNVLGKRTGGENPERWTTRVPPPGTAKPDSPPDNVTRLPPRPSGETIDLKPDAPPRSPLEAALTQIKIADSSFEPAGFVKGACAAFEMIVTAFAQGDTGQLRPLLANDVFENFSNAIKQRQQAKHTLETKLIGFKSNDIVEAKLEGRTAFVTVKFVSEQVNVTRDAQGQVVDGDANAVASVTDLWTFSRDTRARDPNWFLVATAEP
jgi:predicted lipid-binding transport protein (Tim44 family)